MSLLPRQGAANDQPWSLTRDSQLRTELENGLAKALGVGVISGGIVSKVAAFTARVPAGTVLWAEGEALTLALDADYSSVPTGTSYLWGLITRTAANQSNPTASDTYALELSHTTSFVAPTELHIPLAGIFAAAAGIQSFDQAPEGKYLRPVRRIPTADDSIASTEAVVIPAGEQAVLWKQIQVDGFLSVNGRLHVIGDT